MTPYDPGWIFRPISFVAIHPHMLLTKFGKHPIKHVEEEAIIVRRKKELHMRPLPRARDKLGGRTRWKIFWPHDLKSKFEPISFEEGSTWCICMSYIDKLRNIEEIMHIKWKWPFDSCDPKWPQVDLWPHNIGRGSQANVHVWIVWSCYIQRTSYSTFWWKWPFDPCDPKWPQWFFRLITLIQGI